MRGKGILLDDTLQPFLAPERDAAGLIISGLQVGSTLYQNQALILLFHAGALKLHPTVGVGLADILLDSDFPLWRRKIAVQMEADAQQQVNVFFNQHQPLTIDAHY